MICKTSYRSLGLLALTLLGGASAHAQLPVRIEGTLSVSTMLNGPYSGIPVGAPVTLEFELDLESGGPMSEHVWIDTHSGANPSTDFYRYFSTYRIPLSTWSFDIGGVPGPSPVDNPRFTLGQGFGNFEYLQVDTTPFLTPENWSFTMYFPAGFWETYDPAMIPGVVNHDPSLDGPWSFGATYGLVIPNIGAQQELSIVTQRLTIGTIFPVSCSGDGGDQQGCTACPCSNEAPAGSLGGCRHSFGESALLLGRGEPSVQNDTLEFDLRGLIPGSTGLLLSSPSVLAGLGCPSGSGLTSALFDGLRCLGAPTIRHGVRVADQTGEVGRLTPGFGGADGPGGGLLAQGGFTAGQTRQFQFFYREDVDASCGRGINTSNVVSVTLLP